jgi:hypothetical protein
LSGATMGWKKPNIDVDGCDEMGGVRPEG